MIRRRAYSSALPMVFGTETEFGFSYGKVLNKERAALFHSDFPEIIFYLIIESVVKKTGAFVRNPCISWERSSLNHLLSFMIEDLTKAAISGDPRNLPMSFKSMVGNAISSQDIYNGEVGIFLPNGSRLYIDGAHLEYSISECREPYEVVCQEKAMEKILAEIITELQEICGREIYLFKNNTDFKENSYACHENYLLKKEFFKRLYKDNEWRKAWLSFVTTQIIYTGAGKVGFESGDPCDYQISQRADHIYRIVSTNTMNDRPIINHRGESLADSSKWGRFHVILDDSNMSEWPIFLKIGTKALVLNMLQYQYLEEWENKLFDDNQYHKYYDLYERLFLSDPVDALKFISRDLTCNKPLITNSDGFSALEIQKRWLALVKDFYLHRSCDYQEPWILDVINKWEQVLEWIEEDDPILDSILDWRIKKCLIDSHTNKRSKAGRLTSVENLQLIDINYSDIKQGGYYNRLPGINRFALNADIEKAKMNSSPKTRAWLRSQFIKRFPEHLIDVSWELLIFSLKIGDFETKVRIEPDPILSTQFKVGRIFDESRSYEEFCKNFLTFYLSRQEYVF
ncbi:MAG: proteasome accessory factor PafA2 family protein [Patescibacteria group bacterium]